MINIFVLVYAVCRGNPETTCTPYVHSRHDSREKCEKVLKEQDVYWKKNLEYRAQLACLETAKNSVPMIVK